MKDKLPQAFKTMGEVAELLALPPHVIRFWESKIPELMPVKRQGRRYYSPEMVALLSKVKELLYSQGYTLKGVQRYLSEQGAMPLQAIIAPRIVEKEDLDVVQQLLTELRHMRQQLSIALERYHDIDR